MTLLQTPTAPGSMQKCTAVRWHDGTSCRGMSAVLSPMAYSMQKFKLDPL